MNAGHQLPQTARRCVQAVPWLLADEMADQTEAARAHQAFLRHHGQSSAGKMMNTGEGPQF